jgi:hypothetical protein
MFIFAVRERVTFAKNKIITCRRTSHYENWNKILSNKDFTRPRSVRFERNIALSRKTVKTYLLDKPLFFVEPQK